MADLVFVILTVAFFAAGGADPQGGRAAVSLENAVGPVVVRPAPRLPRGGPAASRSGSDVRHHRRPAAGRPAGRRPGRVLPAAGRLHGPRLHQRPRHPRRAGRLPRRWASTPRPTSAGRSTPGRCWRSPPCQRARSVRAAAGPAAPAAEPGLPRCRAGPGVQHRGVVRDQHQLAVLLRRVDHGPPGPDGRPGGAELPVRRRRHGRRRRADPRLHPVSAPTGSATSGSTWSAACLRILLPLAVVGAVVLVALGAVQNLSAGTDGHHAGRRSRRPSPAGRSPRQEAIKELGTNGGGFYNANSAHPFENPNAVHQPARDLPAAGHPVLPAPHVRADGRRQAAGLRDPRPRWPCSAGR